MCEQCFIRPAYFEGRFLDAYLVAIARKEYNDIKPGDICLIISNDPDYHFAMAITKLDPYWGMTDSEVNGSSDEKYDEWNEFVDNSELIGSAIEHQGTVSGHHMLYQAMLNSGYNVDEYGANWRMWLSHKLREFIETHEMYTERFEPNKINPDRADCFKDPTTFDEVKEELNGIQNKSKTDKTDQTNN